MFRQLIKTYIFRATNTGSPIKVKKVAAAILAAIKDFHFVKYWYMSIYPTGNMA